jgi:hypothetical protein
VSSELRTYTGISATSDSRRPSKVAPAAMEAAKTLVGRVRSIRIPACTAPTRELKGLRMTPNGGPLGNLHESSESEVGASEQPDRPKTETRLQAQAPSTGEARLHGVAPEGDVEGYLVSGETAQVVRENWPAPPQPHGADPPAVRRRQYGRPSPRPAGLPIIGAGQHPARRASSSSAT